MASYTTFQHKTCPWILVCVLSSLLWYNFESGGVSYSLPLFSCSTIVQGGIHENFEGDIRRKQRNFLAQRRTAQSREYSGASKFFYPGATGADTAMRNSLSILKNKVILPVFPDQKSLGMLLYISCIPAKLAQWWNLHWGMISTILHWETIEKPDE